MGNSEAGASFLSFERALSTQIVDDFLVHNGFSICAHIPRIVCLKGESQQGLNRSMLASLRRL